MRKFKSFSMKFILPGILSVIFLLQACSSENSIEKRITFPAESWQRFDILKFEFPVTEPGKSYDFVFVLRCKKSFAYDDLPLNMVLNTPSGEERIREYKMPIKDLNGSFKGTYNGDTCVIEIVLKRNLYCSNKGVMKVEIENLNPKLETQGVFSSSLVLIKR